MASAPKQAPLPTIVPTPVRPSSTSRAAPPPAAAQSPSTKPKNPAFPSLQESIGLHSAPTMAQKYAAAAAASVPSSTPPALPVSEDVRSSPKPVVAEMKGPATKLNFSKSKWISLIF